MSDQAHVPHIVIVGGGAGGLELAALLSHGLVKKGQVKLTLIDCNLKHIWKPLLPEVASGTLLNNDDEIDYISYAHKRGFQFVFGRMVGLNRQARHLMLAAEYTASGELLLPERTVFYDYLVLAIGSLTNDFGTPGVKEHCLLLDNLYQAEQFNKNLMQKIIQYTNAPAFAHDLLRIAIIGGGATGVELAAELDYAMRNVSDYAHQEKKYEISLLESGPRILHHMHTKVSEKVADSLGKLGIIVKPNQYVASISAHEITTRDGNKQYADIIIWAAGVKVDRVTEAYADLETNPIHQLLVTETLQVTRDSRIFAFGDCASCPQAQPDGKIRFVPPRAQAAHQQAQLLAKSLANLIQGKPLLTYRYVDYGALITVGRYNVVGHLMSRMAKNFYIEGLFARLSYWSLYKRHQVTLLGWPRVIVLMLVSLLTKKMRARLKLH